MSALFSAGPKVEVIEFTDPVCTWCWGIEPILRKLETQFGEQLEVSYVMGGLVKDITEFYDSYNDIGRDPVRSNANIAKHWLEASSRHGMPVEVEGFQLFSKDHPSSYPQNIAYKAAQIQDPQLAKRFLRRLREASAAEARQTNRTEVLLEIAAEVGLDVARFLEDFRDGNAGLAFERDLALTAQYGARGFPSFLVRYGQNEVLLRGYKGYEEFVAVIQHLSDGKIEALEISSNEESIMEFVERYGSVAPVEIGTAFDLSSRQLDDVIASLTRRQRIEVRKVGNGHLIALKAGAMACDVDAGVCA